MKRFFLLSLFSFLYLTTFAQFPIIPSDPTIEAKIEKQLLNMTLDEKIGQMIELEIGMISWRDPRYDVPALAQMTEQQLADTLCRFELHKQYDAAMLAKRQTNSSLTKGELSEADRLQFYWLSNDLLARQPFRIDNAILDTIVSKYKIGSILNAPQTTAQTPQLWNEVVMAIQNASLKHLGIPAVYGLDQAHGTTYSLGGTLFPAAINMAATFNRDLVYKMGEIVAYETRACNIPWIYGPSTDLGRMHAWSRQYESFGEDVLLSAEMGAAAIRGMQGNDPNHIDRYHVAACLKHYFAYGAGYNGLDRSPARLSYEELKEKHFAPFLRGFHEGALSIMTNSANVNGVKGLVNREYLTDWLKKELGWDGMVVTDWGDIEGTVSCDHVAPNVKEAIRMAINAGVDMMMVPSNLGYNALLLELVKEGKVPMERINDAVRRILRLKHRIGLFKTPNTIAKDYPKYGSKEFADYSRQAAVESIILLKNDTIDGHALLPLKQGSKILVCGPNANSIRSLNGGWSYTWQGDGGDRKTFTSQYNTIYEAMQQEFGIKNVRLVEGVSYNPLRWNEEDATRISEAVTAAREVDYVVACVGENSYAETRGNIADLRLSPNQRELVKSVAATGKPIILVLNEGRGRIISDIEPLAGAIVHTLLPGNYGGDALGSLLIGKENFSGRLPYTYAAQTNALVNYDYKASEVRETISGVYDYNAKTYEQWWFGTGLSYTTYEYSNFRTDKTQFKKDDILNFSVDVKNTGAMIGKETVLLYTSDLYASLMPDNRRLRGFEKIELLPGETKTITFRIPAKDLAFVGANRKWTLEEGSFLISCGNQKITLYCTETHTWNEANIPNN